MARLPRMVVPGMPLHVVQRGNNRSPIFFEPSDYRRYLRLLRGAGERRGCAVHAYVLMTNHVHLLVTPAGQMSVARTLQSVGSSYARYINERYARTGTLFEGRYKSTLVQTERYLLACYRYIELNPVRAGLASDPADYPWSSHRCNALGHDDALVALHPLFEALGATHADRRSSYRELFRDELRPWLVKRIRHATNTGWLLGNGQFRQEIEMALERRAHSHGHGGDRRSLEFQGVSRGQRP